MYFKPGSWFWREEEEGFGVCLLPDKAVSIGAVWCLAPRLSQPTGCRPTLRPALRLLLLGPVRAWGPSASQVGAGGITEMPLPER